MTSIGIARRAGPSRAERLAHQFDSSDESETEQERLDAEEEEERLLSEAHGEASEASNKNKRDLTDQEIEAEYAKQQKKSKKPRIVLTTEMVMGVKGLIRLPTDMRAIRLKSNNKKSKTDAAALYSRQLVAAYKTWTYDLFPSMAMEDVLSRVETFGGKKEIRAYLQQMRADLRNTHLERIYGKEKAERMIAELNEGLQQQQDEFGYDDVVISNARQAQDDEAGAAVNELPEPTARIPTTRSASAATTNNTETTAAAAHKDPTPATSAAVQSKAAAGTSDLVDTDDEAEALFADVAPVTTTGSQKTSKRKYILDDDSDDDDDDEEEEEAPAAKDKTEEAVAEKNGEVAADGGNKNKEPAMDASDETPTAEMESDVPTETKNLEMDTSNADADMATDDNGVEQAMVTDQDSNEDLANVSSLSQSFPSQAEQTTPTETQTAQDFPMDELVRPNTDINDGEDTEAIEPTADHADETPSASGDVMETQDESISTSSNSEKGALEDTTTTPVSQQLVETQDGETFSVTQQSSDKEQADVSQSTQGETPTQLASDDDETATLIPTQTQLTQFGSIASSQDQEDTTDDKTCSD